jgi:DeoR/GlpR family transcriptional regulator of sugar metabolism
MLPDDRHQKILEIMSKNGTITIGEICELFEVSEMTARRDLRILDRQGLLRRVHGGAISNLGRSYEPPLSLRSRQAVEAKRAIGAKAAEMVLDGDSIALDVGSTTLEVARALRGKHNLTIITASLPIANEITANFSLGADVRLILTGGIVRPREFSMVGHRSESAYDEFHVDKAFIAIAGLTIEDGLTEYNLEDALVKRPLLRSAQERIVVAEGSKFGRVAFAYVGPLDAVQTVITDKNADKNLVNKLVDKGIKMVIAD